MVRTTTILAALTWMAAMAGCSAAPPAEGPSPETDRAAEISAADLEARLYAYAHDSMLGREAGTLGNYRATQYLARQARALGLEPAGTGGTFFQVIPLKTRTVDEASRLTVAGAPLELWQDYAPLPSIGSFLPFGTSGSLDGVEVVYGGRLGDSAAQLDPEDVAGKLVLLAAPFVEGEPQWQFWMVGGLDRYDGAAGIAIASLDITPPDMVQGFLEGPQEVLVGKEAEPRPLGMLVGDTAAALLLGQPLEGAEVGARGATIGGTFMFRFAPPEYPARNVVAVLRGSDPVLQREFVAIGAHNDHVGLTETVADHDSVWAFKQVIQPGGAESPPREPTDEEWTQIQGIIDTLRAERPARLDSVYNGADDDGSGSIAVLEIAEAFALSPERPRRSILFVWHTAEEKGLYGAEYFTEHPTVSRDAIVAHFNLDMVGRGMEEDIEGGGPGYVQLIGSRRLSTELGDLVEEVNRDGALGFEFDYQYDTEGHPSQYYCRSDHYQYARWGIPIVFLTTGSHPGYHQLTDEAEYIDYDKLAQVSRLVRDVADRVANLDHRVVVDKPRPDPYGMCVQ
jgi:hypothetical protein